MMMTTKLLAPRLGSRLLDRPRLLKALAGSENRKLTVVAAPAGYGKTVLVSQFLGTVDSPVVWYQIDSFDNDPAVFVQHLTAGIRRHLAGFGDQALTLLARGGGSPEQTRQVSAALVNELAARLEKGLMLVFDDYHLIREPQVHQVLEVLLRYLSPGVHVVIAGRATPPLPLARLRADGLLTEIGLEELKFNRAEIAALLALEKGGPVSEQNVAAAARETQGWAVALRLLGSTGFAPDPDSLAGFGFGERPVLPGTVLPTGPAGRRSRPRPGRGWRDLYTYLAAEVFNDLPEDVKSFLLATAVLEVLTPAFCDTFLGRSDAQRILEFLAMRGFFTIALAGEEGAYRYHQLFREFLLDKIGNNRFLFLRKAGECCLEAGLPEAAVEYFLEARAYEQAAAAIEKAGVPVLRHGRWQTVRRWLWSLSGWLSPAPPRHGPASDRRERPWLVFLEGAVALCAGRLAEADVLLEQARAAFTAAGDREGLGQALLYQARLFRSRGDYQKSLALLETVLPWLTHRPVNEWFEVSLEQSFVLTLQGEFDRAVHSLRQVFAAAEWEDEKRIAPKLAEHLGQVYYVKGEYAKALETYRRGVKMAPDPCLAAYSLYDSIAVIYRDWGDLDRALAHAQKSIEVKEQLGLLGALPWAYCQLGAVLSSLGDMTGAEKSFRRSVELARGAGGECFFEALSLGLLGRLLAAGGRLAEGLALVNDALKIAREQSDYIYGAVLEIAAVAYVQAGKLQAAAGMMNQAVAILERIGASYSLCIGYGFLAGAGLARDDAGEARRYAARCLELAAAGNYLQIFIDYRELAFPVLRLGIEYGLEMSFLDQILKRLGRTAAPLLLDLTAHPDPQVLCRVLRLLAQAGGEEALPAVAALLQHPHQSVRKRARAAHRSLQGLSQVEKENINRAVAYLRENFTKKYHLADVARVANLSPYHFTRVFKAQTGKTSSDYLLDIRVEKAREMLRTTDQTITEICFQCGFCNPSHFATVFKRRVGVGPSEYRKQDPP
jgi:ATP/maltotriose-dependent transcriptional regulator MalT/AraC-like DNA-binding protein